MVYKNPEIKVNVLKTKVLRNLEESGYDSNPPPQKNPKNPICLFSVVSFVFVKDIEKKKSSSACLSED